MSGRITGCGLDVGIVPMSRKTESKIRLEATVRAGVRVSPAWMRSDVERRNGLDLNMKIFKLQQTISLFPPLRLFMGAYNFPP